MPNLKLENFSATFEKTSICKLVGILSEIWYRSMIFQQQKMHESKELGILQSTNLDIREAKCDSNKIKKTNSVSLVSLTIPYVSG